MKVTPGRLSDAEILRFGRSHGDGTINDALAREFCIRALGLGPPTMPAGWVHEARQRICDAINARAERK